MNRWFYKLVLGEDTVGKVTGKPDTPIVREGYYQTLDAALNRIRSFSEEGVWYWFARIETLCFEYVEEEVMEPEDE